MRRFLMAFGTVAVFAGTALAQVAINELDYDNPGTDSQEFVELVGKAGTDLSGWSLVFLNGTGGGASVYNSVTLPSGSIIPNDFSSAWGGDGGFFVVGRLDAVTAAAFGPADYTPGSWTTDQVQNGDPDLVQLYNASGSLVDEWQYDTAAIAAFPGADGGIPSNTGLSQAFASYDSGGTAGSLGTYSSIGRRGYSALAGGPDTPLFVFDSPAPNVGAANDRFDHGANSGLAGSGPAWTNALVGYSTLGPYAELSGIREIFWSGTDAFDSIPGNSGISPGTFNRASYGFDGIQDAYTINIVPEPASLILLGLGAIGLIRRR